MNAMKSYGAHILQKHCTQRQPKLLLWPTLTGNQEKTNLKVPKRENFSLAFFALSEPIWVCDWGSGKKIDFFIQWSLISKVYGFLPHTECAVNKKKILSKAKIKSWWWLSQSPYVCPQCVFLFLQFWFFYDCLTILRRVTFFTAYSVDVGDFLPHTQ